jgi:hypothetical protein
MDFFLFVLLLVGFAALFVALQIYFIYSLIILLIIAMFYIVIRFPRGKDDWPWGFTDNLYILGMTNVIILVFIIVVPDLHFVGSQLTFPAPKPPDGWEIVYDMRNAYLVLNVLFINALMWLVGLAVVIPHLQMSVGKAAGGGSSGEWEAEKSNKPKIGMGA